MAIRYPIAIRLRRSCREASSMRYVTSASTAHAPWNSTPRNNDQATWDRTNGGTFPKVGQGGQRCRVDGKLAVVRNGLDHKDPGVCATKPPTDCAGEADMVARLAIVLRQQLGPACTQLNAFTPNHGRVKISLE